ncbi:MAG TPA: glycosyltransferase [Candidatus Saccharimonadales bacterium]|nr:glycosyltransferase [Candidatus Saccharimonadales bacterium]
MRILMVSDHADPLAKIGSKESGGQNIYVMNIAKLLAKHGHQVDVYTRWDQPSKQEVVQVSAGFRVIRVKAGPKGYMPRDDFLKIIPEFIARVKERIELEAISYDVVFSNYWFSGVIGLELAKQYDLPQTHVYHSIGQIRYETLKDVQPQSVDNNLFRIRNMWEKRIAQACANVLTTSPVERADIQRLFGIDEQKITCIPIGVDLKLFRPRSMATLRQKLKLPQDRPVVLFVGRLELRKGIGTLIKSLADIPKAELYIVGGGAGKAAQQLDTIEKTRLQKIAEDMHVTNRVHFLGAKQQAQVALYYAAADVCVVPSYYEPFGIVPIEAMATGTPVVASRTGGMRFTVVEDETGHLAKPKDHKDLASKINLVLERGKEAYTKAARRYVQQYFSWPKIAKDTSDFLQSLITPRQSSFELDTATNAEVSATESRGDKTTGSLFSI